MTRNQYEVLAVVGIHKGLLTIMTIDIIVLNIIIRFVPLRLYRS